MDVCVRLCVCVSVNEIKECTEKERAEEKKNQASGTDRSDPCCRTPSIPVVRLCISHSLSGEREGGGGGGAGGGGWGGRGARGGERGGGR